MSDPTRSQGTPEDDSNGADAQAADTAAGTAAPTQGGGPAKAQAYVDPSIAAEAKYMTLEAEAADWKDKYVRAQAEMENLRKRTEREKTDTSKYAISKFAGDILAVADNLQRALAAFAATGSEPDPQTKSLIEGVELTESELKKALDRHGVRRIEADGATFDPNFHQAVMEEENKDVPAGTVLKVFQQGYQIGERVLRPSMVVVSKGGGQPKDAAEAPAAEPANQEAPQETTAPGGDTGANQ